jgi:kynurenine formamidase
VLILTGWDAEYGTKDYYATHPVIAEGLAEFLAERKIKMLCLDMPSPDHEPYPIHKLLLAKSIPIAENLKGLSRLDGLTFDIAAFPLNIEAEASLARIVAIIK